MLGRPSAPRSAGRLGTRRSTSDVQLSARDAVAVSRTKICRGLDGIHVLCAGEASWAFRVHDDTVIYLAEAPTEFDTCARADAESLILLTMGRAEAEDTLQRGVRAEKGQRLCDTLFRTF